MRAVLEGIAAEPAKVLLLGGIGSGKTAAVEAVRRTLREAGREVATRVPTAGEVSGGAAIIIDDAHLLDRADLERLARLAEEPAATVVLAAEPREHDPGLRGLITAIERQRPRITLGPLTRSEVSRLLIDPAGHPPPPGLLDAVFTATAGIPSLVSAIRNAGHPMSAPVIARQGFFALTERLQRLDQSDLDALLIASLDGGLGPTDIGAALAISPDAAYRLADHAHATGLVDPSHSREFRDSVHAAVARILGAARHREIESALLRTQLELSTLSPDLALHLAEHGLADHRLAENLHRAAADRDPPDRVRMLRAAVAAGAAEMRTALSDALALNAECSAAAAEADAALNSADAEFRAAAVRVAASVAVHDGSSAQAAQLFDWLGTTSDPLAGSAATIVALGCGDLGAARMALESKHSGPPTVAARAAQALAEGVLATVAVGYAAGAATLGNALGGNSLGGRDFGGRVMPDSAAALVTLAALHGGDPVRARSVIGRAVAAGADPLSIHRHRLLQGWVHMQDGHLGAADAAAASDEHGLHARDALWAAALRTATARRRGDAGALQKYWSEGVEILTEYTIDLYSLLPLGELWMAAARLRRPDRLAAAVERAFGLLSDLGDPPAWAPPLHWAGVHVGILANDPTAVAPHGQALAAAAEDSPLAAAMAASGRTWLRVLANQADPAEVARSARLLAEVGLTSDATRLAGQAALVAADSKISALMLQIARDLKVSAPDTVGGGPERKAPMTTPVSLSDREREVAELLLLGMPYRDIGTRLFISAKTVEHHVARIRRRIGAQSRPELLSILRTVLESGPPATG